MNQASSLLSQFKVKVIVRLSLALILSPFCFLVAGCARSGDAAGVTREASATPLTTRTSSTQKPKSRTLNHRVLPIAAGVLSPDGRWLIASDAFTQTRVRYIIYQLPTLKRWRVDLGRQSDDYYRGMLTWREDSRVCFVGAEGGSFLLWPARRQVQQISRSTSGDCVAWSPKTKRLAIFEGNGYGGNGNFQIWDGRRLRQRGDWATAVRTPSYTTDHVWQCEWSPDEKSIVFRFYGRGEREPTSAAHTTILNPRTGLQQFKWGAEACPVRWLDSSRLAYRGDDDGLGGAVPLIVSKPRTGESNMWLQHVVAWMLSPRRDTIWALTQKGDLYRTPASVRQWQLVARTVRPSREMSYSLALSLSPRGDMIAIHDERYARHLSLVSTSSKRRWQQSWRVPQGTFTFLGWARGQTLPLLEVRRSDDAAGEVWQLTR